MSYKVDPPTYLSSAKTDEVKTERKTHILVIDDEVVLCDYLGKLLEALGYSVSIAFDGMEGIDKLKNENPDITLADLVMPGGVGGMDVLNYAHQHQPDSLIIMMTGRESQDSAMEALRLGAFDFISKPFKIDLLRSTLKRAQEVIARRQTEKQLARRVRDLAALNRAAQAITASLEPDQVLQTILREVTHTLGADSASVLMKDQSTGELLFLAANDPRQPLIGSRLAPGQGIAGWVAEHDQSLQVDDVSSDERFHPGFDLRSGYKTLNILAVPLRARGQVIGVLEAVNKLSGAFDPSDLEMLESLALTAAAAIENARLFKEATERLWQLQQTQAQLEATARMATAGGLARGLAHEINNALTPMLGTTSLLLDRPDLDEDMRKRLQVIAEGVRRIGKQIKQFADLARPRDFQHSDLNLNEVVHLALGFFNERLKRENVEISMELSPDLPRIKGNMRWLSQAMLHLILNAIEAMPGGGRLEIQTTVRQSANSFSPLVCVSVGDNGIGIPEERLKDIFDIGYTTKTEQGRMRGLGIGLFDVRNLVQAHGGKVEVESEPGRGSKFTLILPVGGPLASGNPSQES